LHRRIAATLAVLVGCLCTAAIAFGLPPFSTAPKSAGGSGGQAELYRLTAACHATFDRLVIRARFGTPGYDVRYVARIVHDPSGNTVSLPGAAKIHVVMRPARGHTSGGAPLLPSVVTPHCPNLLQVKSAGDFEGVVSLGLGIRHKTGFRVFRLTGPRRLVIDIAH
jgi:hypothetical protein